jgi:protein Mpv17
MQAIFIIAPFSITISIEKRKRTEIAQQVEQKARTVMVDQSRNVNLIVSRIASMRIDLVQSKDMFSLCHYPQHHRSIFPVTRKVGRKVAASCHFIPLWMTGLIILYSSCTAHAFVSQHPHQQWTPSPQPRPLPSSQPSTALSMSLQDVSDFYAQFPMQSAILTCGVKASLADSLAQFKDSVATQSSDIKSKLQKNLPKEDSFNWEFRRNLAYVIYGGIFVGLMCHLEYNVLFPMLFGSEHTAKTILEKVIFDDFISAPLMWLPPAYLVKALVYDYSMTEGLGKYWRDIQDNSLLTKYWSIWVPAQTISFSVVPDHLRVAFMASVSFFWFILFSSVSHDEGSEEASVSDVRIEAATETTP